MVVDGDDGKEEEDDGVDVEDKHEEVALVDT